MQKGPVCRRSAANHSQSSEIGNQDQRGRRHAGRGSTDSRHASTGWRSQERASRSRQGRAGRIPGGADKPNDGRGEERRGYDRTDGGRQRTDPDQRELQQVRQREQTHARHRVWIFHHGRGNVSIVVLGEKNVACSGNLSIVGSEVTGENVLLATTDDLHLLGQAQTSTDTSTNKNSGWTVGIGVSDSGSGGGKDAPVFAGKQIAIPIGNGTSLGASVDPLFDPVLNRRWGLSNLVKRVGGQ
ncbi:hemagglutinin repeat-containing protein [Achromobacter animicus]|uniref:hemagglutinin repeat-containing protein n=1 Tax=Achromobacter animicus TaxID=1389935 RepID=UPI00345F0466